MLKPQCVSTSLRLRLYSLREWIHNAVSLRETQGDTDRYKEMKREKTHTEIEKDAYGEKEYFLQASTFCRNQTKANRNVCF